MLLPKYFSRIYSSGPSPISFPSKEWHLWKIQSIHSLQSLATLMVTFTSSSPLVTVLKHLQLSHLSLKIGIGFGLTGVVTFHGRIHRCSNF